MTEFYLAPMEGVTGYTYRNIFDEFYGGVDKYYTPFISSVGLKGKVLREVSKETNNVKKLIPQILTNNPETFLVIAEKLKGYGYEEVNLNIGCPSRTVTAKGRGGAMLRDTYALSEFLKEITDKCPVSISLKTRMGIESLSEWPQILKVFNEFPIKELIVHSRLLREMYNGNAHMDIFAESFNYTDIPLCYNGDIRDVHSFNALVDVCPHVKAVMLGRGIIANPSLAEELKNIKKNNNKCDDKSSDIISGEREHKGIDETFIRFHDKLFNTYSELFFGDKQMLFKMKELWTYWNTYLNIDSKLYKKIIKSKTIAEYSNLVVALGL